MAKKNELPKKKKKPKDKGYVCTNNGCDEQFGVWKTARSHMIEIHETKNPKLKNSSKLYKELKII
jgi:hypothetical protein